MLPKVIARRFVKSVFTRTTPSAGNHNNPAALAHLVVVPKDMDDKGIKGDDHYLLGCPKKPVAFSWHRLISSSSYSVLANK
jgi:hypothetical protein